MEEHIITILISVFGSLLTGAVVALFKLFARVDSVSQKQEEERRLNEEFRTNTDQRLDLHQALIMGNGTSDAPGLVPSVMLMKQDIQAIKQGIDDIKRAK